MKKLFVLFLQKYDELTSWQSSYELKFLPTINQVLDGLLCQDFDFFKNQNSCSKTAINMMSSNILFKGYI